MSLKAFHLVFIGISTLLALGFGFWAIRDFRLGGGWGSLLIGVGSLIGAVGLVVYGRWFLTKLKDTSYL